MKLTMDQRELICGGLPSTINFDEGAFLERNPELKPMFRRVIEAQNVFNQLWEEFDVEARKAFDREHEKGMVRTWFDEYGKDLQIVVEQGDTADA